MNRRDILKSGLAAGIAGLAPGFASAQGALFNPVPKGWRTFVLTTRVEPQGGATKAWIRCRPSKAPTGSAPAT